MDANIYVTNQVKSLEEFEFAGVGGFLYEPGSYCMGSTLITW